jgi:hypothetical protein
MGAAHGRFTQTLPLHNVLCALNLLCVRSTVHHPLLGLFSRPHRDELPMPPFVSVFGLHAISFLSTAVIRIVCFFFFFFLVLLVSFLVVLFFLLCYLIFLFIPLFPYTFSFLFLFVIRLYPLIYPFSKRLFLFDLLVSALVQTLGCGCERFSGFRVEENEFQHKDFVFRVEE